MIGRFDMRDLGQMLAHVHDAESEIGGANVLKRSDRRYQRPFGPGKNSLVLPVIQ